jgi:hypothetical protein
MDQEYQEANIIHQEPLEIGGETVISELPDGYEGPCAVVLDNYHNDLICAFQHVNDAIASAIYVTKPDGGYCSILVVPCCEDQITHKDFEDWAFH